MHLKVFNNKANGQSYVVLPKKALNKIPDTIEVKFPKEMIKKTIWGKLKW